MFDLSTLSIPSADIVPEPTDDEIQAAVSANPQIVGIWHKVVCGLARRCRELEAEIERLKQVGRDFTPGLAESTYDE